MATKVAVTKVVSEKPSTILDQLKKLDADRGQLEERRQKLLAGAKSELLAQGQTVIAALRELGFTYSFVPTVKKSHHKQPPQDKEARPKSQGTACTLCGFSTRPEHDRRAHRHMAVKAPFTDAELEKRGMVRV